MMFDSARWPEVIRGLPDGLVASMEEEALAISIGLPPGPDEASLVPMAEHLRRLEEGTRAARALSEHPESLPRPGASGAELALWALGLAHFLTLRRVREERTVGQGRHVAPVSRGILETADRIGARARAGLETLRREHEARRARTADEAADRDAADESGRQRQTPPGSDQDNPEEPEPEA